MRWIAVGSPIGTLGLGADSRAICGVQFGAPRGADQAAAESGAGPVDEPAGGAVARLLDTGRSQLARYFAGELTTFDLPSVARGGSAFEQAVWAQIAAIPYGQTTTYGQIASAVGVPDGARAVGLACNRNPLPILVPCHRVVGAGGKLVGFGGGLARKRFLLQLEAGVCITRDFSG